MRAFNHNIKLIRSLTRKNQQDFAKLIRSKVSNVKTWETTQSIPRDEFIYQRIAELASISIDDLKTKKLDQKDISLKVEIVEDDSPLVTPKQYLKELQEDKQRAINREEKILNQLVANSTAMMQLLNTLSRHDRVFHETILKSLGRLEGGKFDLIAEARSYEAAEQVKDMTGRNNVEIDK